MIEPTPRQKHANRFLRASEIGTVSFVVLAAMTAIFDAKTAVGGIRAVAILAMALWATSLIAMFVYRKTDEYTQSLWSAGASSALIAMTFTLVFGSLFEQLFYNFFMPDRLQDPELNLARNLLLHILMLSFFAAVQIKRMLTA